MDLEESKDKEIREYLRKEVITIGIVLMVVGTIFTFVALGFGWIVTTKKILKK